MQTTLRKTARFTGLGLHSGRPVRMEIKPAAANHGIWFRRTDVAKGDPMIAALWSNAIPAQLCTKLSNEDGVTVATVEHVMAALAGCGIQNAVIELDGPEVPVLDGSSIPYVTAFIAAGRQELDAPVHALQVLKPVQVTHGTAVARLVPADSLEIDFRIEFDEAAIGTQHKMLNMANGSFVRELCDSRTFCMQSDVEQMHAAGLALGGSIHNAVVYDQGRVLSPGGLRHSDEAVRHKMLDAMGDLALAGAPILGRYEGFRAGHALTNKLLRALFADPDATRVIDCSAAQVARLPGAGVKVSDVQAVA
ncbi:UDP-3-O-(3-hydroxymyristoyl) glucosamine N-acyltransferase [Actibacterium mucosum KCTC 23349]|uniref:UDP-3-O-acyl-N-acetylglucosamine deacetylase n=1 Tax=Actibacterium mucosum KCTC 23349 TaxID=1454373 RepID=A0A037ZHZ2_9RHOB|nr:UDP-3-O-acyl-N-acetylglucosamine deacetylase [Actibacterium mucosum]KAJ55743.1 UDP-3-O-(3-hydroxymyristoyl) glucosamine N-acyltransferase [Actibacterium mucosum KCTC 23349]